MFTCMWFDTITASLLTSLQRMYLSQRDSCARTLFLFSFGTMTSSVSPPLNRYLITWHVGLFVTLTLAQIGVQGRKQQYW